jgi:tetratricopeptide (TPR) repeat protein
VAFFGAPPNELQQAERDARRAEALRPNSGLTALALIHDQLGRWAEAEREYQVALATVDRTEPTTHDAYSIHLMGTGRLKAALVEANEAYRLAPAVRLSVGTAAIVTLALARDADALKFADLLNELGDPSRSYDSIYGTVALRRGHFEEASARLASSLGAEERAAGGAEATKLVVLASADPTKVPEARKALDAFARRLPPDIASRPGWLFQSYTLIGALDEAYAVVDRALDEHVRDGWIGATPVITWLPEMRPLRRDARFQQLVTRFKLIDYWKQYGPPDDCDLQGDRLVCR